MTSEIKKTIFAIKLCKMSELNYKPNGGRLLVKPEEVEEKYGNIVVPTEAKGKPFVGEVVAVGEVRKDEECYKFSVGDKVHYRQNTGTEIELNGEDYLIFNQSEILGTL